MFNICCFYTTSVVLMLLSISQFTALTLDFKNGDSSPSWLLKFSQYLSKIQICACFYFDMQYLMKIGPLHMFIWFDLEQRNSAWSPWSAWSYLWARGVFL